MARQHALPAARGRCVGRRRDPAWAARGPARRRPRPRRVRVHHGCRGAAAGAARRRLVLDARALLSAAGGDDRDSRSWRSPPNASKRARRIAAPRDGSCAPGRSPSAVGAALLALPGLLASLREAAGFVGKGDPWATLNAEQRPLVERRRPAGLLRPLWFYGGFGYVIPLVPLGALAWARETPTPRRVARAGDLDRRASARSRSRSSATAATSLRPPRSASRCSSRWPGRPFARPRHARIAMAVAALLGVRPLVAQHVLQARASLAASRTRRDARRIRCSRPRAER